MNLNWLKLKVIFNVTAGLDGSEEISEVQRMQMGLKDGDQYETELGIYPVHIDPIMKLNPKCFIPKDKQNKKYYTEVIFQSEFIIYADGKPEVVYKAIEDYYSQFPELEESKSP